MLETMSAGRLVVGSRPVPVDNVIRDGDNGLPVDSFNPGEIAGQMVAALAELEAFVKLHEASWQMVVKQYDLRRAVCLRKSGFSMRCGGVKSARLV